MAWLFLWAFAFQYILIANADGIYSVSAPDTIRSYIDFNVAVTLHSADGPCRMRVSLDGPSFNMSQEVHLEPMSSKKLTFRIPKLSSGDYHLTAEGLSGVIFKETSELAFSDDKPSIYIQTDKATYKPGDLVQFRVIFLDRYTQPARIHKPISIQIHDGQKNQIEEWSNVRPSKGVFSGELRLSSRPVLGNWTIGVTIQGESTETKVIRVDKYVLPKFGVRVETPTDVVATGGDFTATIQAKYTFGKPVKGKATIAIEGGRTSKTVDIDGTVNVELPYEATLKSPLKVVATVTDELTDLKHNGTAYVTLHQNRYILLSIDWPQNYMAGKEHSFLVAVTNVNGSPVTNSRSKVKFSFVCGRNGRNIEVPLKNSAALGTILFPDNGCSRCEVTASFEGSASITQSIFKLENALRIEVSSTKHELSKKVKFDVVSTEDLPYFMFTIAARGNIILNAYVRVPRGVRRQSVSFIPNFGMVPQATLFVSYVVNGEMRSDQETINFQKDFGNSIEVTVPEKAEPGEVVNLSVKTDPHSFVGLLGVDQSVLLLGSGNDLSHKHILDNLSNFASNELVTLTNAKRPTTDGSLGRSSSKDTCGGGRSTGTSDNSPTSGKLPPLSKSTKPTETRPVRQEFPETWLFENITDVGGNGAVLRRKMPDTITSWVITGFSLNPNSGFAMTKNPSSIRVFRPFFISTNLPYSVKRGEIIAIPVVVFNYLDRQVEATVWLDNSDQEYDFSEVVSEKVARDLHLGRRYKRITVPAETGASLSFMIRPKKAGLTSLKITAQCNWAQDSIHERLRVEADGVTKYVNKAILVKVNARSRRSLGEPEKTIEVELPPNAVPGSEVTEISVGGDIQAPTLGNLGDLVELPHGCGEQNMINFVPNIMVLWYLQAMDLRDPALEQKAKRFLATGYQTELTYKHSDGSYSTWGPSRSSSSTWLTAYVIRSFHMAKSFTHIDTSVLSEGLSFLASKQGRNGEFPVNGVYYSQMQSPLAFTSFVLLTFFENEEYQPQYQHVIDRGVQYVESRVDECRDQFSLAIAALVLSLSERPKAEEVLNRLDRMARHKDGLKWWSRNADTISNNDVELTSYVFLAMLENEFTTEPLPIVEWLAGRRNRHGGFGSTQDTVLGLQALTKFAVEVGQSPGDMDVLYSLSQDGEKTRIKVTPEQRDQMVYHPLPEKTNKVFVRGQGTGISLVQLTYRHNVASEEEKPSFRVTTSVKDSPKNHLKLEFCAEYTPIEAANKGKPSNMALMEIQLPSGFVPTAEDLEKIRSTSGVKLVETNKMDSIVVVYFDSLSEGDPKCVTVSASRAHYVGKHRPSYVEVYDYYVKDRRARVFYAVDSSLCDICEGEDCGRQCLKTV
ncbi:thioester-containing protein 1 allele R1 isoform X2 [Drosophila biarmipes]|uniref:thioester-containing protein 1 allele R1 isoform X2 n=1 Tax=Drosophila biarmipes TaxID=125945 RepID=UPI0021CCC746|nr:thioester-containing protein 1 allele R1 isoform X2 [Drosophila biarmipes]